MKLNGMLPHDIGIFAIHDVGPKAHARFDATERGYCYLIHTQKDPFLEGRSTRVHGRHSRPKGATMRSVADAQTKRPCCRLRSLSPQSLEKGLLEKLRAASTPAIAAAMRTSK